VRECGYNESGDKRNDRPVSPHSKKTAWIQFASSGLSPRQIPPTT